MQLDPNYTYIATNVVIKNEKVHKLWHNSSSYGHIIEHNRWLFSALLKSIKYKILSIIGRGLAKTYIPSCVNE